MLDLCETANQRHKNVSINTDSPGYPILCLTRKIAANEFGKKIT